MTEEIRVKANRLARKIEAIEEELEKLTNIGDRYDTVSIEWHSEAGNVLSSVNVCGGDDKLYAEFAKTVKVIMQVMLMGKLQDYKKELEEL